MLKKILKKVLDERIIEYLYTIYKYKRDKGIIKSILFALKGFKEFYLPSKKKSRAEQIYYTFKKIKLKNIIENNFVYYIDVYKIPYSNKLILENFSVDYSYILNNSLNDLYDKNSKLNDSYYKDEQKIVLDSIGLMINKTINKIEDKKLKQYFENMIVNKANSFEEAIQRILFYNQLLWQTGHHLNGLGRLDMILYPYYKKDIESKKISKDKTEKILNNFLKTLNSYYWFKSSSLLGDTGQIIILGGLDSNNKYNCNDLTYMFIKCMRNINLPDPKVLLRVSNKMPRDLLECAVDTIKTGIGCPLFANDDVIISKLIEFGYDKKDSYNYVTSACWEPFIVGKAIEHNNISSFVFMEPFNELLEKEDLNKINSVNSLLNKYYLYLDNYIDKMVKKIDNTKFEYDPLVSLFIENCNKELKDVTEGGAIYNNYGITTVSLPNVINSILNIDKYVFKNKKYTLEEVYSILKNNYKDNDDLPIKLKEEPLKYCVDDNKVIDLVNNITSHVDDKLKKIKLSNGGMIKFGLSSPNYISNSKNCLGSFDGRKQNEPFTVHISSDNQCLPYTEIFSFASKLDYSGNRFNGNVVDFIVEPNFIDNNYEKFIDFLQLSIEQGFFEMQMNVISSDILIKAKDNPKEFPNLIVRVWGFSAYFNDLPLEYKNLLIERALLNESKNN